MGNSAGSNGAVYPFASGETAPGDQAGASGEVKPPIVWDAAERTLVIRVVRGFNLAKKDIFGTSDPYVRISVLLNEQQVNST